MPQFMHFRDSGDTLPFVVRQNGGVVDQSSSAALLKLLLIRRNNLCGLLFCFLVTALLYVQLYKFPNQLQLVDRTMDVLQNREAKRRWKNKKENCANEYSKFAGPKNDKQKAVRDAFLHAWRGYKQYAWGHDLLKPVTRTYQEWIECGLTIVDSLDTLLIMGLNDEFNEAKEWVAKELDFDKNRFVSLFETTIRILGGLLSAYHLSGDQIFLTKAEDIGRRLLPGISDSPTAVPYRFSNYFIDVNLRTGSRQQPSWSVDSSLAEIASLQLEFRDLARLVENDTYETLSFRVSEHIHDQPCNKQFGLCPMFISPTDGRFREPGTLTFGARADSYYEYLLKQWLQTGKTIDWLEKDYRRAMDSMQNKLWKGTVSGKLYFVGEQTTESTNSLIKFSPKMDHLVCFLAGTLALGTQHGMPSIHLEIAKNLSQTCQAMYENPTGLGPEIAWFNIVENEENKKTTDNDETKLPPDLYIKSMDAHSLLRPEAFEAWFYLHRITGDPIYKEWGWNAFKAIEQYAKVESGGYSSVQNVKRIPVHLKDMMESFFLGESLKYLYLLFADDQQNNPDIPLDKWIFNTEAHPLPVRTH
uniref:alpha-1,2-Mannosidase n=1 Tax=Meloidogyne incognita TaxID=6306 RepID=A0A914N214_MELIC